MNCFFNSDLFVTGGCTTCEYKVFNIIREEASFL